MNIRKNLAILKIIYNFLVLINSIASPVFSKL